MIKVVFIGTPEFSVPILEKLIENKKDYSVVGVVSQPDKKVGRKQILTPSPVSKVALDNNIFLLRPVKIKEEYAKIKELNPDIIITSGNTTLDFYSMPAAENVSAVQNHKIYSLPDVDVLSTPSPRTLKTIAYLKDLSAEFNKD